MCSESIPEFVNAVLFTGDDGIDRAYNFLDQETRPLLQGNYFSIHYVLKIQVKWEKEIRLNNFFNVSYTN